MHSFFPVEGFLGTGAPFAADVNLVVQAAMGFTLIAGAVLARRKRYRAHGICQTSVLLLNLVVIVTVMWPSMRDQVMPAFPSPFDRLYFAAPTIHAALGTVAELLGLYIVVVAGTKLLPERLRFTKWKMWMRAELALWWITLLSGFGTYCAWYLLPVR
jgi:uncharacterized membrane protein YozB (DUF420 family)